MVKLLLFLEFQETKHGQCEVENSSLGNYPIHSLMIVLFHFDTMTKQNNPTYHIYNKCNQWRSLVEAKLGSGPPLVRKDF